MKWVVRGRRVAAGEGPCVWLWLQPPGTVPSGSPAGLCSVHPCPLPPPVVTCASKAPSPAFPRGTKSSSWWTSRTSRRWVRPLLALTPSLRSGGAAGSQSWRPSWERGAIRTKRGVPSGLSGRRPFSPRQGPASRRCLCGAPRPVGGYPRAAGCALSSAGWTGVWCPRTDGVCGGGVDSELGPSSRLPLGPETFPRGRLSRLRHSPALSVVSRGAGTGVRRA